MPVIKSAKKKLKQDKKRETANQILRKKLKTAVSDAQKSKNAEKIKNAFSIIDKAVKKGLIHKNKAGRIKSRLSKLVKPIARGQKRAAKASLKTKPVKRKK